MGKEGGDATGRSRVKAAGKNGGLLQAEAGEEPRGRHGEVRLAEENLQGRHGEVQPAEGGRAAWKARGVTNSGRQGACMRMCDLWNGSVSKGPREGIDT
eukprot:36351-Chlamydomonas_euryale.AAC.2